MSEVTELTMSNFVEARRKSSWFDRIPPIIDRKSTLEDIGQLDFDTKFEQALRKDLEIGVGFASFHWQCQEHR